MGSTMIAAALLALQAPTPAPGPAPAANEELVAEDNEGRYFLDPASVRRVGDRVFFQVRTEAGPRIVDGVAATRMTMVIDCARRTAAFLGGTLYDAAGQVLQSRSIGIEEAEFYPILASFAEDRIRQRVCGG